MVTLYTELKMPSSIFSRTVETAARERAPFGGTEAGLKSRAS